MIYMSDVLYFQPVFNKTEMRDRMGTNSLTIKHEDLLQYARKYKKTYKTDR